MKNSQKGFAIPIIIIILALLAVGGGVFFYTQREVKIVGPTNSSESFIDTSESVNSAVDIISQNQNNTKNIITDEKNNDKYYYIPEIGIKFVLTEGLGNLTHTQIEGSDTIWFFTKELSNIKGCGRGDAGILEVYEEEIVGRDSIIQDSNTYVYFSGPHGPCSINSVEQNLQSRILNEIFETLNKTAEFFD